MCEQQLKSSKKTHQVEVIELESQASNSSYIIQVFKEFYNTAY